MKRILVIGGTGYIGSVLVEKLRQEKYKVVVLSRHIFGVGAICCDILNKKELLKKVKNFDMIINLAAIVRTTDKDKYKENIKGLENILYVMEKNNIDKLVYFSSQIVHKEKTGPYGDSKKECERILKTSTINHIIIRPNYVYGVDKYNDFFKLLKIVKILKGGVLLGKGNNLFQPINNKSLAREVIKVIQEWKYKIVDIGGDTTVSLNQIVYMMNGKYIIHIPICFLKYVTKYIPFDIEGYEDNMLAKSPQIIVYNNIQDDIQKIKELKK